MDDRGRPRSDDPGDVPPGADESCDLEREADRLRDETVAMPAPENEPGEPLQGPVPPTGRARISGVEAGVAAGITPPGGQPAWRSARPGRGGVHFRQRGRAGGDAPPEPAAPVQLPDWSDPPTREVPRAVLGHSAVEPQQVPGPVWREDDSDWDLDSLAFADLVNEGAAIAEHGSAQPDDLGLVFDEQAPPVPPARTLDAGSPPPPGSPPPGPGSPPPPGTPPEARAGALPPSLALPEGPGRPSQARGRVRFAGRSPRNEQVAAPPATAAADGGARAGSPGHGGSVEPFDVDRPDGSVPPRRRNPVVATVTGLAIGGVTLLSFFAGSDAVLALSCLAFTIAMAECYQALRRAQYRPAALLGLVATPGAAVAAYLKGPEGILLVAALVVVLAFCWYVLGLTRTRPVQNISVTVLGWIWVGGLSSFVGLLASSSNFPARHGLAYLLGAVEATVAYDVGGYLFGSLLGRHKLAPFISPNKTWEGLLGGSLSAVVVALAITSQMAPWTLVHAAELGVVVAVVAPLGDLAESMVKRDLRVKDMGTLLPHHGGLLDRVDGLLFVLPAVYYLARTFHG